jgi:hypothetical protein
MPHNKENRANARLMGPWLSQDGQQIRTLSPLVNESPAGLNGCRILAT